MAETDEPAGWRPTKAASGCVIDVTTGQTVARGFAMPHSPRWYNGKLWVLDSGNGALVTIDPQNGQTTSVAEFPGYTRGLAFAGPIAFVGLSRIRETSVFGGIPIAAKRDELCCGVAAVDLRTGNHLGGLRFHSGVEEIFDVQIVPHRQVKLVGPLPEDDQDHDIWVVPPENTVAAMQKRGWPSKRS